MARQRDITTEDACKYLIIKETNNGQISVEIQNCSTLSLIQKSLTAFQLHMYTKAS